VGGRIDAIGLSVVMPEGPRRIPGRLSVAPAPPAVRKLSGTYISSASAFRILAGACLWSRRNVRRTCSATARRCRYSCERRTAVSAPVRNRHYLPGDNAEDIHWKAPNCGSLALVSRSCRARTARFLGRGPRSGCAGGGLCLRKVRRASRSLPEGHSDAHSRADDLAQ